MDIKKQKQLTAVLKIITLISFLCIIVDNGFLKVPMILLLIAPFIMGGVDYANDIGAIVYKVGLLSYGTLLMASLIYIFVSATSSVYTKRTKMLGVVALLFLWLQVILTLPDSFANLSHMVYLTYSIFTVLSLITLFFMLKTPIDKKIKQPNDLT